MYTVAVGHTGMQQDVAGCSGMYTVALGHTGMYTVALGHAGMYTVSLGHTGMYTVALGHTGMQQDVAGHIGTQLEAPKCTVMHHDAAVLLYRRWNAFEIASVSVLEWSNLALRLPAIVCKCGCICIRKCNEGCQ